MLGNVLDNETGEPTPDFQRQVDELVSKFLQSYHTIVAREGRTHPQPNDWFTVGTSDRDGHLMFWGLFDMATTPDEDVYVQVMRYAYAAVANLRPENIKGYGIVNADMVIFRQPLNVPGSH